MERLQSLGWDAAWASAFQTETTRDPDLAPARVSAEHRGAYDLLTANGEVRATAAGRLRHHAHHETALPAVGDWVACSLHGDHARIHHVLPRRTALVRKLADERIAAGQVVAANLDTVFIATSLNQDLNPRRIERILALVWESGATPVVLLTKADLCADAASARESVTAVACAVPVHVLSPLTGVGCDALLTYLGPGRTAALLGSSGVGKSTLANHLLQQERIAVQAVRLSDDHGRHTTTARQLFPLPMGGALIDTPGLRGVGLWESEEGLQQTFSDIEELTATCRFRDCGHEREPGCAIGAAMRSGALTRERVDAWKKLARELAFMDRKRDQQKSNDTKRRWKAITKEMRRRRDQESY